MRWKIESPRGRWVRRHPRKLFKQPGRFTVVDAYQELMDRLRKKAKAKFERQMNLPFDAANTTPQIDRENVAENDESSGR
ncbi:MAG: hypothetical protein K8F25_13550 [Fimbriimonadaceae bacterium]|nr:hypothetical protein [Alphaproteobacteria bacterium]